jgi:hypothetical protein
MNPTYNIWIVSRNDPVGYDEYYSFVVSCETLEQARFTHPRANPANIGVYPSTDWLEDYNTWPVDPSTLTIKCIGSNCTEPCVIHTSFKAG